MAVVDALLAGDEHHYLEWECRLWRGRIRLAGGRLEQALADAEAAHALAVEARDPQDLHPTRAFLARALLAAGRRDEAAEVAGRLLDGLGGGVLGPDLGADLGLVLAELGIPAAALDRLGIPPSPWLAAARALADGDPLAAADAYAAIGSLPDEADARLAAARLLGRQGRPAEAEAQRPPPSPSSPRRASPGSRPPDRFPRTWRRYRGVSVGWDVSGMQRTPPRHLAPPQRTRPRARDHLLVESILAVVAIGLTTAILIGSLLERPESSAARLPNLLPPAPTTTRAVATTPSPATTRPAPGRRQPARRRRVRGRPGRLGRRRRGRPGPGRGGPRGRLGAAPDPRVVPPAGRRARRGGQAEGGPALRGDRLGPGQPARGRGPGQPVRAPRGQALLGRHRRRRARAGEWQRLDVSHDTHRPGTTLAVEILAPTLTSGTNLLVDDLAIRASSSMSMS